SRDNALDKATAPAASSLHPTVGSKAALGCDAQARCPLPPDNGPNTASSADNQSPIKRWPPPASGPPISLDSKPPAAVAPSDSSKSSPCSPPFGDDLRG